MRVGHRSWMLAVALSSGLLLSACSSEDDKQSPAQASAAKAVSSDLLSFVPDNTPYVVANTKRLDDEMLELMWSLAEPSLKQFNQLASKEYQRLSAKAQPTEEERLGLAVLGELNGKISRAGLTELGLDTSGDFAMYGLGVLPVARFTISDPAALSATVSRIEKNAGQSFPKQNLGGIDYYEAGDKDGVFIASIQADQLVLGILPTRVKDALLPEVLGLEKPARSIADSGRLEQANAEYGLLPWGTLLVDTVRFVDLVMSDESEAARELFGEERMKTTPECVAEYREMAGIMPRVVSGYTDISEASLEQFGLFELRSDIAAGLTGIKAAIPGLADVSDGMFYFAMGMNLVKAKEFMSAQMAAVRDDPYQCEYLAEINADAEQANMQINQPLPPFVSNIRGIRINVAEADMAGAGGMANSVSGQVMVAMNNPQLVLGMAQAFVPQLAELQIGMDGEPVPLPTGLSPVPLEAPHVAMVETALGFSVGDGQQLGLKDFLEAEAPADAPFMSIGYDAAAIEAYQKSILAMVEDADGMEIDPSIGLERLERITASFDLTPKGIEFVSTTYLKP